MTALNITALTQSEGMSQVICVVNNSVNGLLTMGFILAVFFVMLLIMKKWDFSKGMLVASWSCFLISLLMSSISCPSGEKWLNVYYSLVFLLVAGLTALYVWSNPD